MMTSNEIRAAIAASPAIREPVIQIAKLGRIRVTAAAAVNSYCYMILDI